MVNAAYSSFIGNIQHKYFDSIASSLEIGRRGYYKFTKDRSMYPNITIEDTKNLNNIFDVYFHEQNIVIADTWIKIYKQLKEHPNFCFGRIYRNNRFDKTDNYLASKKSKIITFR